MAVALALAAAGGAVSALAAAELSADDRQIIGQLLGADVMGAAATAGPLTDKLAPLREGTWTYQIVSGTNQGQSEAHVVKQLARDASGVSWRYQAGPKNILFLSAAEDGSLALLSQQDIDEGVVVKYSPGEPLLVPGLQPGDSKQIAIDVKVYDLSNPDELQHSGKLDVTYSHLGAYKVTVPAGSYDAALIKWAYKGKIGPASVEDTQYRFLAPDIGMVASVDKKDISALLLYHDDSKTGKVLQKGP
jgi:hypothetical protein